MDTYISYKEGEFFLLGEEGGTEEVSGIKAEILSGLYQSVKPSDEEITLLSLTVNEMEGGSMRGILNYRVNGKHKQKRF